MHLKPQKRRFSTQTRSRCCKLTREPLIVTAYACTGFSPTSTRRPYTCLSSSRQHLAWPARGFSWCADGSSCNKRVLHVSAAQEWLLRSAWPWSAQDLPGARPAIVAPTFRSCLRVGRSWQPPSQVRSSCIAAVSAQQPDRHAGCSGWFRNAHVARATHSHAWPQLQRRDQQGQSRYWTGERAAPRVGRGTGTGVFCGDYRASVSALQTRSRVSLGACSSA